MTLLERIFISKPIKKFRRLSKRNKILKSINRENYKEVYFLVSYPKSGNTWLRTILANLLIKNNDEISLKNVGEFIPDTYSEKQLKLAREKESQFRRLEKQIFKSHDPYYRNYKNSKVIYLIRNGQDAIYSYYHYLCARREIHPSIESIIDGSEAGSMGKWSDHVCGWLEADSKNILVVKYEDLKIQPFTEVNRIVEFIQLEVNEHDILIAIEKSNFEEMKKKESELGYYNDTRNEKGKKMPFVRKGEIGGGMKSFNDNQDRYYFEHNLIGEKLFNRLP